MFLSVAVYGHWPFNVKISYVYVSIGGSIWPLILMKNNPSEASYINCVW